MAQQCVYCGNQVVWADVLETDEGAYASHLADTFGMEALTEHRQVILMGRVCALCVDEDEAVSRQYRREWHAELCTDAQRVQPKAKPFTCPACKGYMVMEAEDYCGPGTEYMCVECGNHWDA